MVNKELFTQKVKDKMMNKCLTIIAEEAFFRALPYSFADLSKEDKVSLHEYVGTAIEHFGGAKKMLQSAMESFERADRPKYLYMKKIYDICTESATEVANRKANELKNDEAYTEVIADADFTEEEFKKFESNSDALELDEVGKIIGEKVVATIKSEQQAQETETQLNQAIVDMVSNKSSSEEEIEKGVESFCQIALGNSNPRHPVSLFSKLHEIATESISYLHKDEASLEGICKDALFDTTYLFSVDSYKMPMSAMESFDRLMNVDVYAVNDNVEVEPAVESMQCGIRKGFETAITAYTLMETLNTMNLHSLTHREIEKLINTNKSSSVYNNTAVESFITNATDILKSLDNEIRGLNTVEELEFHRGRYTEMKDKINSVGIATESFVKCKDMFINGIDTSCRKIDDKISVLMRKKPERNHAQQIAFEQDVASFNRVYSLHHRKPDADHLLITADPTDVDLKVQYMSALEAPITISFISLNNHPEDIKDYVKEVIEASKYKENSTKVIFSTERGLREHLI